MRSWKVIVTVPQVSFTPVLLGWLMGVPWDDGQSLFRELCLPRIAPECSL